MYGALGELLSLYVLKTLTTTTTNNINCSFEISLLIMYEDLRVCTLCENQFFFLCVFFCAVFLNNKSP